MVPRTCLGMDSVMPLYALAHQLLSTRWDFHINYHLIIVQSHGWLLYMSKLKYYLVVVLTEYIVCRQAKDKIFKFDA